MKWFKHISDSLDDPFIQDLMDEFGSDGYLVFFGILEIMAREFDHKSPGKVTLPRRFCRRKLRLSWQKISTILGFCHEEGRIFVSENGRKISLNCPKLETMCDDWTKRQLRSEYEPTPKKHHLEVEEEVEEEVEVDKKKNKQKEKALQVLDYLNQKTGKRFRRTDEIMARLKDGGMVEDCKQIIDNQSQDNYFIDNPKYMNPTTLFRKSHWDKYLNNVPDPLKGHVNDKTRKTIRNLEGLELT